MKKKRINRKLELSKNTISHLGDIKGGLPHTDPRVEGCFSYVTNTVCCPTPPPITLGDSTCDLASVVQYCTF